MINTIEYLLKSAELHPTKIAFADEKREITFSELKEAVIGVAWEIQSRLNGRYNSPIAVYIDKSVECLIAMLGVVYSGNFYTPIDTDSPEQRTERILNVLEPVAVLYVSEKNFIEGGWVNIIIPWGGDSLKDEKWYKNVCDVDPVYILFTSGSTGSPKGVVISHRSVIDYTEWLNIKFKFDDKTIFGNQAPFYFDNSVLDIYSTLRNAATMYIIPGNCFVFAGKMISYLESKKINTIFWVPSALIFFSNSQAFANTEISTLKKILFCGEIMPCKCLNVLRRKIPNALFANLYGPTEITDVCSCYIVDREFEDTEVLPIGFPCENTDIIVLNEGNQRVVRGEVGELCVKGTCLSRGYYGDFEKSSKVFVQNPLNNKYSELIYRTGDLVKYNEYGELIYIGRRDFQIKHQGHRIELGEIEIAAGAIEGIRKTCVLYNSEKKKILLFCEGDCNMISEKEIYKFLKQKIPGYMLPAEIIFREKLPLNFNGKIDRVKLGQEIANE